MKRKPDDYEEIGSAEAPQSKKGKVESEESQKPHGEIPAPLEEPITAEEAFIEAASYGNRERVQKLIADGVDVNADSGDENGYAMAQATAEGHLDIVKDILKTGRVSQENLDFSLREASGFDHKNIVSELLEAGAKVIYYGGAVYDALTCAAESEDEVMTRLLLEKGEPSQECLNSALSILPEDSSLKELLVKAQAIEEQSSSFLLGDPPEEADS